jgi:glycosyltransferase involved in cell wall biosynthesis
VVVDDGSTDETSARAEASGAQLIRLQPNRGKGAALRRGLLHAHAQGFRWALVLDGDGQHRPDDIPRVFRCAEEKHADLVIGNRLQASDGMPRLRLLVNKWMTARISKLCGLPIADSQCGFRLLRLDKWASLSWRADRFEVDSEMVVGFVRAAFRVEFVPIQVVYNRTESRISPVVDTYRWLRWWFAEPGLACPSPSEPH